MVSLTRRFFFGRSGKMREEAVRCLALLRTVTPPGVSPAVLMALKTLLAADVSVESPP